MPYKKLSTGFSRFQEDYFQKKPQDQFYQKLSQEGQKPENLIISCSDSRIDPALLTQSVPGTFFSIRNVAAFIPPLDRDAPMDIVAALHFALDALPIKNIIVMGHEDCGGIAHLAVHDDPENPIYQWMRHGEQLKADIFDQFSHAPDAQKLRAFEQGMVLNSLSNLLKLELIEEKIAQKQLFLYGWYFDMYNVKMLHYDPEEYFFREGINPSCPGITKKPSIALFLKKTFQ